MSYKGMMDGWHGDENECDGTCGICESCEYINEKKGEMDYEGAKNEE